MAQASALVEGDYRHFPVSRAYRFSTGKYTVYRS